MATKKTPRPPYEPSDDLRTALAELAAEEVSYEEKRQATRKAVADELRASGQSHGRVAEHTPWTEETVRGIATEYDVPPKTPGKVPPPYEPSPEFTAALAAWAKAEEELGKKRTAARKAVADELRTSGVSQAKVAAHTPWTEATVRTIAREYKVPPLRKPTVRSIRD
ncbi:hypothetical protein VSR01_17310 [Actinacidiphila sp. DG2A-62]|uniref:hypothetical protein n=1 Tax=Actinacidiphila sp. DG2A-62 TaxID=3108821 RepID=UPI002DC0135A|nr:hypothetical protein [Actinacidiphila sp. DG2A-62]MEC3995197.1 hypothetical protein [Actinacidiphila sp. DG2A-62]